MRLLFVKRSLASPRTSGHDVYCYHMMQGLQALGAEVGLATIEPLAPGATDPIPMAYAGTLRADGAAPAIARRPLSAMQERYRSFWGIETAHIDAVAQLVARYRPDVVIAFGLEALPFLAGAGDALRVWAMADEWVFHHLSQVRLTDRASWGHVKDAAIKGLYERVYRSLVDRVWVVSDTDRRAARWFAGMRVSDLLPNGVDTDYYRPLDEPEAPRSTIFWGRLDFGPNIDALRFYCTRIWPAAVARVPDARFTIIGYQPTDEVARLARAAGATLLPNVPDLRAAVCQHAVVVLPFVSGGGIKNKLLEGAAMGRAVLCTPLACRDLRFAGEPPLVIASSPDEWASQLTSLWADPERRRQLGLRAREWVVSQYSWAAPSRNALDAFAAALAARRPR